MIKSLAIFAAIATSALCSANAFAWSRAEVWAVKNSGGVHREFYIADDGSASAKEYRDAERELQARGQDKPDLSAPEAAELVKDCLDNVENVRQAEHIAAQLANTVTGGVIEKTIIDAVRKLSNMLATYDARLCFQAIERRGLALPSDIERRYFPERFTDCRGQGGC